MNGGTRFGYVEEFLLIPPSSEYNVNLIIKMKKYINDKSTFFNKCDLLLNSKIDIDIDGLIIVKYSDSYPIDSKILTFDNIFKYKPLDKLSIDFLVNISENKIISKGFECKIVKLIVSAMGGTKYVEFESTKITNKDDELRKLDNNIITNNSVVEFIYDETETFKWVPYRLRPDKTIKKAPNAIRTAQETFKLIIDPITQDMITGKEKVTLSNEEMYRTGTDQERQMVENLRKFHNQIKTDIIKLASETIGTNLKIIDLACGAGGDLHKFNNSNINYLTGIDKFEDTIREARIRFTDLKKISLNDADFFQGDLTLPLEDCAKGNDSTILNKVLSKYIGSYDIANCQFAIHYFFKNNETLDTFLSNVHKALKMGGLFIGTTLNGNIINEKFKKLKGEPITINSDNDPNINLYKIKKIYTLEKSEIGLGCNIVPKIAGLTDNIEEWLVNFDLLKNICKDYGFEIIKLNDLEYEMTFEQISKLPKYKEIVNKMSNAEKEYSYMHSIFMFKKIGQINNSNRLINKSVSLKPSITLKQSKIIKPSISISLKQETKPEIKPKTIKEETKPSISVSLKPEINKEETKPEIIKEETKPTSLKQSKKISISLKKK